MEITTTERCPCGSGESFGDCCQPYLLGQAEAPTAEGLMRSRYTAYYQGHVDYLVATHHPTQRYWGQRATIAQSVATTTWLGLRVMATEAGQAADDKGVVEFIAYHQDPRPGQIHERWPSGPVFDHRALCDKKTAGSMWMATFCPR